MCPAPRRQRFRNGPGRALTGLGCDSDDREGDHARRQAPDQTCGGFSSALAIVCRRVASHEQ
jgi:hypothetical protein